MSIAVPNAVNELLNYRLNTLLASSGALTTRRCEGRFGITRREWRFIALLAVEGPLTPTELSDRASLEPDRISRLFASLREKKLVFRTADTQDRRRVRIELTVKGRNLYDRMFPVSVDIHQSILSVLSASEMQTLDDVLSRLTDRARELNSQDERVDKADRRRGGSRRLVATPRTGVLFPSI